MISRRGLFGLFGGVAAAPLVKALPAVAEPEIISGTWEWKRYAVPQEMTATAARIMADNVAHYNSLMAELIEKRLFAEEIATETVYDWNDEEYED